MATRPTCSRGDAFGLWKNLTHFFFSQNLPNKCCHGWRGSSVVQLAVLNQTWGKPPTGCSLFWQSQHVAGEHPDHTKKVTGYYGHVASSWQGGDYSWAIVIIRAKHSGAGTQLSEHQFGLKTPSSKQILSVASCYKCGPLQALWGFKNHWKKSRAQSTWSYLSIN